MKRITVLSIAALTALTFVSCEDDNNDAGKSKVQLVVKANTTPSVAKNTMKNSLANAIAIESFWVNIDEIEFDLTDEWEDKLNDSIVEAQELKGPFLVNLMSPEALNGFSLGTAIIPDAVYEEVEFEFDRCLDVNNKEMNNRSMYITGKINSTPFILWYNDEVEFEISLANNTAFSLNGDNVRLFIDFNITQITSSLNNLNLSSAVDGNNNGIIEIGPNDLDGNNKLAEKIIEALEESVELDDSDED